VSEQSSWISRLRSGLTRSSEKLTQSITALFTKARLDDALLEKIEDALIGADLGVSTAAKICAQLKADRYNKDIDEAEVRAITATHIETILSPLMKPLDVTAFPRPHVVLVVGVNGSGKTTTIAKLAHLFQELDYKVLLAAGDTFRAAAIDQLRVWGERLSVPVLTTNEGGDAAGLAYSALEHARQTNCDALIIDTAGRLQNKADLMAELAKIRRVLQKLDASAPHDVVLVLDATTGQNALNQIEVFSDIVGVTGLVMTKLDGTARGGVLVAAAEKFHLPIHAIGVGEKIPDLRPFDARSFARAMTGLEDDA
jgi:fused signal recognition particle receptor